MILSDFFSFLARSTGSRGNHAASSFIGQLFDLRSYFFAAVGQGCCTLRCHWGVFISCVGETWARLQADEEKQECRRYVPSPHSPGLLSSFPSVSAALWCTDALHSLPATAWCVWSVWSGEEKEKWGHTNGLMKAQLSNHLTAPLITPQLWQSQHCCCCYFNQTVIF